MSKYIIVGGDKQPKVIITINKIVCVQETKQGTKFYLDHGAEVAVKDSFAAVEDVLGKG